MHKPTRAAPKMPAKLFACAGNPRKMEEAAHPVDVLLPSFNGDMAAGFTVVSYTQASRRHPLRQ
ncbi:hypothetical protein [Dyella sp.]|uniref:hypothetical protein n=1 Tax=Dyella sp. TaxID=1869338 RepID=UPI002ED079BE